MVDHGDRVPRTAPGRSTWEKPERYESASVMIQHNIVINKSHNHYRKNSGKVIEFSGVAILLIELLAK
jgi:hypothetical protein